jgi:hypothetical protein
LETLEVIVNLIANTQTSKGLTIQADLNVNSVPARTSLRKSSQFDVVILRKLLAICSSGRGVNPDSRRSSAESRLPWGNHRAFSRHEGSIRPMSSFLIGWAPT